KLMPARGGFIHQTLGHAALRMVGMETGQQAELHAIRPTVRVLRLARLPETTLLRVCGLGVFTGLAALATSTGRGFFGARSSHSCIRRLAVRLNGSAASPCGHNRIGAAAALTIMRRRCS